MRRPFALVALVALAGCDRCGRAAPPTPKTVVQAVLPKDDGAEAREAARAAAAAEVLALPAEMVARLAAQAERADPVDSAEGACAVLPGSIELAEALQKPLSERAAELADSGREGEFAAALGDLNDAMPIVSIDPRPAGPVVGIDYSALADRIGSDSPGGKLLEAAAQAIAAPHFVRVNEEQSCLDYARGLPAMRALAAAWPAAPGCLRAALREVLARELAEAVDAPFCGTDRDEITADADAFAAALAPLADLNGAEAAARIRRYSQARDAVLGFEGQ